MNEAIAQGWIAYGITTNIVVAGLGVLAVLAAYGYAVLEQWSRIGGGRLHKGKRKGGSDAA